MSEVQREAPICRYFAAAPLAPLPRPALSDAVQSEGAPFPNAGRTGSTARPDLLAGSSVTRGPETRVRPYHSPSPGYASSTRWSMTPDDFPSILREGRALTVDGAFEKFLDKEINISKAMRHKASTSQQHIRDFLADEHDRDPFFPRLLSDADFLGGSFARHTKVWPLDDIDIYFSIDGHGLIYTKRGWVQPYTIVSDDVLDDNPLLLDPRRWMKGNVISSRKLIDGFAEVLDRHYHAS